MKYFVGTFVALLGLLGQSQALATPPKPEPVEERAALPTVAINDGTLIGEIRGNTESFAGIPFAQPPVGPLRLKPPQPLNASFGTINAFTAGPACPQMLVDDDANDFLSEVLQFLTGTPLFMVALNQSEDCLYMTVQRPAGTTAADKLPVLFWIFGGGFELGWSSMYDGIGLVEQGIALDQPFIYVAVAYRVGGFGFLPGSEILADGSANLGLLDQRLGLEWVADNIAAFGGDPDKVTIWGESAGAISVFDQMALYDGDNTYNGSPLFRGAIMNSGSIVPADPVDGTKGNEIYAAVVKAGGCSGASDTLECLRGLSYEDFLNAANSVPAILSYNSVALSYLPRPDGTALTDSPDTLALNGKYAAVPFIIGDQEDEGTLFALFQGNLSSTTDIVNYLQELYFINTPKADIVGLVDTYDTSILAGSPYNTGILNEIYPVFKLLASILGDLVFTLTRRVFLESALKVNPSVPTWSYLSSYDYGTPILGTGHGTDILQIFYGILPDYASGATQSYYINFINNLNPNTGVNLPNWPQWSKGQELMQFWTLSSNLLADNFRNESYQFLLENYASFRI
ncbi:Alpha/Beta hydrolase protein [Xylariales sp. PMI_506]|nr:Alpha/Beta hydrolase protein [Xylariales sp. PMI_506]